MPKGRPRVKKIVERELRSVVNVEDKKSIIEELAEEVEKESATKSKYRVPGLTHGSTKVTYTYQDLCKMFPIVSFIPEETVLLTFQGVPVQARAGVKMHVPECFKNIHDQHRREQKVNVNELKGLGITVDLGAGSLT